MTSRIICIFAFLVFLSGCAGNQISEAEKRKLERESAQAQKSAADKAHRELDRETR